MKRAEQYNEEKVITLQRCLYLSRLKFEEARLMQDFDLMRNCLENLKGDLFFKASKFNLNDKIKLIDKYLNWYDTLTFRYSQKTREGTKIIFPATINIKINQAFSKCYILLSEIQDRVGLT